MATRVHVELVDDLDGTPASETVVFGLDGTTYEVDLSEKNAAKFRKVLAGYVEAGRRTGRRPAKKPAGNTGAVREWAQAHGYKVADRGAIPKDVREAYDKRLTVA